MYINLMLEENKNKSVIQWLLLITLLVAIMIIIGGLTRLTDSGLSITNWDLFSGIFPPFTFEKWEKYFSLYKEIPEFYLENPEMTLAEFKIIFWWEYIHRLLGRIIGVFYIIPLIYFTFKNKLKKETLFSLYNILFLICIQGFIGWYMVKSGLTDRTDVSHYRLSLHLTLAFIIFILLLWNYLKYKHNNTSSLNKKMPKYLLSTFLLIILIQISVGALVSGLDAGKIYQSWPLMNSSYYPDDSDIKTFFSIDSLESPSVVQFVHRNIAYFVITFYLFIFYIIIKNDNYSHLKRTAVLILFFLCLQMFLGIVTVLSGANIILASLHQIGSIFLVSSSLVLIFKNAEIN